MLHDKIYIHDWVNFEHTVTKYMENGDLKSSHDLINILFKYCRSNNAKINESPLKIVCSSLVKIFLTENGKNLGGVDKIKISSSNI